MRLHRLSPWKTGLCLGLLCAAAAAAAQDPSWLKKHDKGKRYEGFLDRPNASRSFELLGFFAYREPRELQPSDTLHIEFFQPKQEPVFIRAKELRSRSEYFMAPHPEAIDAHPGSWSHFDDWPAGDVLAPSRVPLSNLGVMIRLNSDNDYAPDLAPAIVYAGTKPSAIQNYTLYMSVNRPLSELTYTLKAPGYTRVCAVDPVNDPVCAGTEKPVEAPIDENSLLRLRFAAAGLPANAPVTLHLDGHYANSDGSLQADFHFFNATLTK